jgi:hypothetical protein
MAYVQYARPKHPSVASNRSGENRLCPHRKPSRIHRRATRRKPTRRDLARTALGIIFCTAVGHNPFRMGRVALATGARGVKLNVPPDLGANVDARHHCNLCCPGNSVRYLGASHSLAPNTTRYLSRRAGGGRMRVRISAHPLAGSVGPLAFGPLHFKDAQKSFSRKHAQLGVSAS